MLKIATILHATDFSPQSEHAFHLGCSLARDHGGRVIVLHVAERPLIAPNEAVIHPPPGGIWEAVEKQLHAVQAQDDCVSVEHRMVEGYPAIEILRAAEETKCDLIVMGTHGRTGFAHLLLGSVAEEVVRKSICPVLVVKAPFPERPFA